MNFMNPMVFNQILNRQGLLDEVYEALRTVDMVGAVMSALKILRITHTLPIIVNNEKTKERKHFYVSQQFQKAFECYNKALLYAPKDSIELVQAYSNRSALHLQLEAYTASIKDIETCLNMNCTEDLKKKLMKRKFQCQIMLWKESLKDGILRCTFSDKFFNFKREKHPQIPCLSSDVHVVSECGETRVVAAKDVEMGTVLAIETAYATYSLEDKAYSTCYYCQKITLNLFPCDNCCYALFCSKECQKLCLNEYHYIECKIMNVLQTVNVGSSFRLAIKTVLKLKTQCKEWNTLIKESQNIGTNRLKTSSLNEIYDVKNYSSILSFNDKRHFVHGVLYNSCLDVAIVIHHLQNLNGFFPTDPKESLEAQKCFAKLFMSLELMWPCTTEIDNAAEELTGSDLVSNFPSHFGWFAFTSKLKHACEPNVLVLGLDNRVALVALKPIKKNAELKISHIGHWYERLYEGKLRSLKLYQTSRIICTCRVCKGSWTMNNLNKSELTPVQKKAYSSWERSKENILVQREASYFKEICKILTVLQDKVQTKEHHAVYKELRVQLCLCQYAVTVLSPVTTTGQWRAHSDAASPHPLDYLKSPLHTLTRHPRTAQLRRTSLVEIA
ncbi:hypothetical protein MSG28_013501 [Choristoneura fumiferana]|uniref:Uncharacterized protein n=1 Tax=Choristoneura fumiferana TaxID=7141 RepID=A0ACC0KTE9_CHOFU|nr:hypothetical protein MSG28_013501 [Choristoneura fumiferana]